MLLEEGNATGLERVDRANSLDRAILLQFSQNWAAGSEGCQREPDIPLDDGRDKGWVFEVRVPGTERAVSTAGATLRRSAVTLPSWTSSQASFTAPHASWPVTTMTLTPAIFAAYSSDPSGSSMLHIPGETAGKEIANALVKHLLDGDACVYAG